MKKRKIFVKVFLYTILFLIIVIGVTAVLFSQQIVSFYNNTQTQFLSESFSQLRNQLLNAEPEDYSKIAREFSEKNQSYSFAIQDPSGFPVFASIRLIKIEETEGIKKYHNIAIVFGSGYTLLAVGNSLNHTDYSKLVNRILLALVLLLVFSIFGAVIFARQMTRPIKKLVSEAETMSKLKPVLPPEKRNDEIGELSQIVHEMYGKLKDTIADLEGEKETQRYFFAAASHELKTPITAVTALLQGMLDNIGEYKDHPKYLWECIKLMKEQNKIITEILEIVKLTDKKIKPDFQELSLRSVTEAALLSCQTLIEARGQRVDIQIPREQIVTADDRMLNRAMSNIIANAVQNTPDRGEIRLWSDLGEEYIRLYVLNTGTRIDEDILPKLFNPFYRVDEARSANHGRSGLGLTIVSKTLECMGFSFALENVPQGVLFWIDFPVWG